MNFFFTDDPVEFLQAKLEYYRSQKNKSAWTQKALSKRLGYRSDRSIGMVLKRQRCLTPPLVSGLGKVLNLTPQEYRYFDLLVQRDRLLKRGIDSSFIDRELQSYKTSLNAPIILR